MNVKDWIDLVLKILAGLGGLGVFIAAFVYRIQARSYRDQIKLKQAEWLMDYLFVYGTLRKDYNLKLKDRVKNELEYIGQAKVAASMYDIGRYPGAVKSNKGD